MYRKEVNAKDVLFILENLREEDKLEAKIQLGKNYINECLNSIMLNKENVVLGCRKSDNKPVCMGGCVTNKGFGTIWLLSTNDIKNYQTCVLRNIKKEIEKYQKENWILCNVIYCKNKLAKIWLKKMGFRFDNRYGIKTPKDFEFFYKTNSRPLGRNLRKI